MDLTFQPWDFFGRNGAKAETPVLWPPHAKSWLIGKDSDAGRDWGQEEKGTTEDEMAGWHHWLHGRESEWTPGVGYGQGGLACCDSWGRKESDTTERLMWCDVIWSVTGIRTDFFGDRHQTYHSGYYYICLLTGVITFPFIVILTDLYFFCHLTICLLFVIPPLHSCLFEQQGCLAFFSLCILLVGLDYIICYVLFMVVLEILPCVFNKVKLVSYSTVRQNKDIKIL